MTFTWRRGLASLGALALVACGAQGEPSTTTTEAQPPVEAHALPARPAVPVLEWAPCTGVLAGFECATALVPLDYDQPKGAKTFIALARIPASDQAHRIGSLFINPGGPGASGIDLLSGWGDYIAEVVRGRYDVVGFDPRGVGWSEQFACWSSNDERNAWSAGAPWYPVRRKEDGPYFDYVSALWEICAAAGPQPITGHMSTADAARDLDLLRRAVGDARLNYLGFSYGSFLGQTYANLFPERVGAFVIDGVLDPRLYSAGLWPVLAIPSAAPRELDEFLRLCDEAGPGNCALATPGTSARARFQALADALYQAPFDFPDFTYNFAWLGLDAWSLLYDPNSWAGEAGYAAWLGSIADAVLGNPKAEGVAAGIRTARERLLRSSPAVRPPNDNVIEAHYAFNCGDTDYPGSLPNWRAVADLMGREELYTILWWDWVPCARWPTAHDRYVGPWATSTASPVLIVGNTYDGVTGYEGALAANRLLRRSRLLTYAGWGHTAFGVNPCVDDHVGRYLVDGILPPEGTVCPANANPFLPAPSLRAEAQSAPAKVRPPKIRPPAWPLHR